LEHHLKTKGKEDFLKEIEYISDLADIHFIRQKKQRGLGDAIYCAKKHVGNDPFVVMLGDTITKDKVPCTKQLIDIYNKYEKSVIALEEVPDEKVERYGIIGGEEIEENIYKIDKLVEKPPLRVAPSNLAIMGRYVLTPDIFDCIEKVEPGYGGEIQLTDALSKLDEIYGQVFTGESYDIGNRIDWLKSSLKIALEDDEARDILLKFIQEEII
jgi:UTP--glucose-1-phosphate uridylyltransferase